VEIVERLLGDLTGREVHATGRQELGNSVSSPVTRLTLDREYDGIGRTVIVKSKRQVSDEWGSSGLRYNEQQALEHLQDTGLTPRFLAGVPGELLVMTDLGPGPTLQQLLFGDDPEAATDGLVELSRVAGTLHRQANPSFSAPHEIPFLDHPLDLWTELADATDELGFPAPGPVELADLADALERVTTFSHGDLTPNNVVLVNGRARLIDLEGAGRRHPGFDAACLRLPFPHYGHWAVLPSTVLEQMETAYREALDTDESTYEQLMATGCAAWGIVRASRLRLIASTGQDPAEAVRRRTQIVQTLISAAASMRSTYPVLGSWFEQLAGAMQLRWEEARLPPRQFRAFEG
jgi:Ser/Thr protein kinase RdoA (MazF antagonist)